MKNTTDKTIMPPGKTNWNKVITQTDSEIYLNIKNDPDSGLLKNKKYYKPEKGINKISGNTI